MTHKKNTLGFVQEFYALDIRIGTLNDTPSEAQQALVRLCEQVHTFDRKTSIEEHLRKIINQKIKQHFYQSNLNYLSEEQVSVKIIRYEEQERPLRFVLSLAIHLYDSFEQYGALQEAQYALLQDIRSFLAPLNVYHETTVSLQRSSAVKPRGLSDNFFQLLSKTNLFWSASGASILLLEESYTDHNKYKNLGAAILLTGMFAFVSAIFALSYLTDNWFILVPVALLWCLTVINIDMMIINTMVKYKKSTWKSFFGFLSRLLLGVAIAISISIPVEMTLLEDEIRDEIERYDRELLQTEVDRSIADFSELDSLNVQRLALQERFNEEMQGQSGGSGRVGYGIIAQKIEAQIQTIDDRIEVVETKKDSIANQVRTDLETAQIQNNKYGFLASYRALHRLQYEGDDNSVFYIALGIKILLLLIELLPIISKSLMRRGAYDSLYELEEQKAVRFNDGRSVI